MLNSNNSLDINNVTACTFCGSTNIADHLQAKSFAVRKCQSCTIAFTHPPPILPEYEEMDFHAHTEVQSIASLPRDWQQSIATEIGFIKKYIEGKSNILEIGCGDGLLLSEIDTRDYNVSGIEPSMSATKRAQAKGLNVKQGFFPDTTPAELQDAVIMTHVFEHVKEPVIFIDELKEYLKPDAKIIFAQTNYKGLVPSKLKEQWYAWVPEHHYWHFTSKGLTSFMKSKGFKKLEEKYVSLVHEKNTLYRLSKLYPKWIDQFIVIYEWE